MKAGDKLYCKKTYYATNQFNTTEEWVTKGKTYKVVIEDDFCIFSIIDNDGEYNNTLTIPKILNEYFYTQKELRKLKLQKIMK